MIYGFKLRNYAHDARTRLMAMHFNFNFQIKWFNYFISKRKGKRIKKLSEVCRVMKPKNPWKKKNLRLGNHESDLVFYARITLRVHFNHLLSLIEIYALEFLFYFKIFSGTLTSSIRLDFMWRESLKSCMKTLKYLKWSSSIRMCEKILLTNSKPFCQPFAIFRQP